MRFVREELSRWARHDLPVWVVLGSIFFAAALFDPYSNERPYSEEHTDGVSPGHLTLQQRLGYAILQSAGYGQTELKGPGTNVDSVKTTTGEVYVKFNEQGHSDLSCLGVINPITAADGEAVDVRKLAIAILAAEKYNRSSFLAWTEAHFAELLLRVRGQMPDFSLGIAQIRPQIARRVLYAELGRFDLPDRDLLALLTTDCQNARIAGQYVRSLTDSLASSHGADEAISITALAYNGSDSPTPQAVAYSRAVRGAYDILRDAAGGEGDAADPKPESAPAFVRICVWFSIGSVSGRSPFLDDIGEAHSTASEAAAKSRRSADVKILVWQWEPGPASYRTRLLARRRAWLEREVVAAGYSRERITIHEAPGTVAPRVCEDPPLGSDSEAVIEVPKDQDASADSTARPPVGNASAPTVRN